MGVRRSYYGYSSSLAGRKTPLPDHTLKHYMYQLCKSLDHMHRYYEENTPRHRKWQNNYMTKLMNIIIYPSSIFVFTAAGSSTEMWSQKTFSSKWDYFIFLLQESKFGNKSFKLTLNQFTTNCSKMFWSLETLGRVGACTPSPRTRSTSQHAGTEPQSASSLTATTAWRWTSGALVVFSLRSWGTSAGNRYIPAVELK